MDTSKNLDMALTGGDIIKMEAMIKNGKNPNIWFNGYDNFIKEWRMRTFSLLDYQIIKVLLEYGLDPNKRDILHDIIERNLGKLNDNAYKTIELLLQYGANSNKFYQHYISTATNI